MGRRPRARRLRIDSDMRPLMPVRLGPPCRRPILNATTSPLYARRYTSLDGDFQSIHMVPDFGTEEKHPLVFTADRTITQFKVDVGQGIWSRPISLSYAQVVMMKRAELERGVSNLNGCLWRIFVRDCRL